ncbi:MFS transporter [Aetokthonos hydrillicola]|uniref:MFS transporter n=1 Tax=Aetokthonos hydrillicola TaxID=1550245 RepID=UPI001ABA7004|nr:MFS transporter [Aetokthonos hydrillicola]MBO3461806.1 MFS transporter [Aetokthonos hydrillicola CCALA 1050]MBW4589950.1 MFS transporter [Aetokthonos hydrillicola CCALA 1050]
MENQISVSPRPFLLQASSYQVWIQVIGRILHQVGHGSIHFFMPLIFVNELHFSATMIGLGISIGSLTGVIGNFVGGYLADSPRYGRKQTLLLSGVLSIAGALMLAWLQNFPSLIVANILMGLSGGCYWTPVDALIIDTTPKEQRQKAFALLGLASNLGTGIGVLGGGILLSILARESQVIFAINGLVLVAFLVLIQIAIPDTRQENHEHSETRPQFGSALKDRTLLLFVLLNVLFTTYIALVNNILPLYFTNFISAGVSQITLSKDATVTSVANLFTWFYVGLGTLLQLPLVQLLGSWLLNTQVLMISMILWGAGFFFVWATHLISSLPIIGMIIAFSVLTIASDIYRPFSATFVAELAPESLRGVYLAISHQCWPIGLFFGPLLGGWAMDQSPIIAHYFWIAIAVSSLSGLVLLYVLKSWISLESQEDAPAI